MKKQLSIVIPIYNEEEIVGQVIENLKKELIKIPELEYEIIAINDASIDGSKQILEKIEGIKLISHPYNKGYGAGLKTGIREAKFDYVLFFDADDQHPAEQIKNLLQYTDNYEMVSGARIKGYKGPITRQPGKKLLSIIANYLTGVKIPDLNCGFRIVKKEEISKFLHIMPSGFSFSTTSMLAFLKEGLNIKFIPIEVKRRTGKSTVKPKDAIKTLMLIIRIIILFSPLKIFFPISLVLFIGSIASGIYDIFARPLNITDITLLLFISSLLIFFFGLLADQLAAIRREIK